VSDLPQPQITGDFYAAAVLAELGAIRELLSDRLPTLPGEPVGPVEPSTPDEPIAIAEPAPARRPYKRRDNGKASR
jgi:hypothetical protein